MFSRNLGFFFNQYFHNGKLNIRVRLAKICFWRICSLQWVGSSFPTFISNLVHFSPSKKGVREKCDTTGLTTRFIPLFAPLSHTHNISLFLSLFLPLSRSLSTFEKSFSFSAKRIFFGRESLLIEGEWHPETIPEQHLNTFWHFDKWQNKWKLWCCVSLSHKPDTKYLEHGTRFLSKTAGKTLFLCMISCVRMLLVFCWLSCSSCYR